jgi:predicted dehydrogenase
MNRAGGIRFAILGCGAVTECLYLPAFKDLPDARVTLLIDSNAERRKRLASMFSVEHTQANFDSGFDHFDAAIVALPHVLHATASIGLLSRRKAVLVEKPMGISSTECDAMIDAAERTNTPLAVGLMRRFLRSHRFAAALIKNGSLGRIVRFDFREGFIYDWPVASDFPFRKDKAGGGVLIDLGSHTLDCILHWLGDFSEVEYFDDAEGGVEANCLLNLRLSNGATGIVELSRTRLLRNTVIIECEKGVIEISRDQNNCKLSIPGDVCLLSGSVYDHRGPESNQGYHELFREQLEDFIAAIRSGRRTQTDGKSAKASISLIETCYRHRKPMQLPWLLPDKVARG